MLERYSTLLLTLVLLTGCKYSGQGRSNVRLSTDYTPAVPPSSLTTSGVNRQAEAPATDKAVISGERSGIEQVSATDSTPDLRPISTSEKTSEGISLQQSISLALSQNPDLVTLRQSERVSSATLGVAQTYPFNPFVQVQATPYQDARNSGFAPLSRAVENQLWSFAAQHDRLFFVGFDFEKIARESDWVEAACEFPENEFAFHQGRILVSGLDPSRVAMAVETA